MSDSPINDMSLQALGAFSKMLEDFTEEVEKSMEDWYMSLDPGKGLRLWHRDGWSSGYFDMDDGMWMFHAHYAEAL